MCSCTVTAALEYMWKLPLPGGCSIGIKCLLAHLQV